MIKFATHVFNTGLSFFCILFGLLTGLQWIAFFASAIFIFSLFMSFISYRIIDGGKK